VADQVRVVDLVDRRGRLVVAAAERKVYEPGDGFTKVLVVVAHPDDVDFGAAGTVATLTAAGVEVVYCMVTSGDAGSPDPTDKPEDLAAVREREQRAAAAVVGVTDVRFLRYPDGTVTPSLELRRDISRVIRQVQPDRIICQSPERNYDRIYASHPDHLAAGEATICAVYPDARNHHAHRELMDEGHLPHTVREIWIMASTDPNLAVDTTDVFNQKVAALKCHVSQVGDGAHLEGLLRPWGEATAKALGLGEGRLAEGFRVVATA
jgi:LmbE family N-acetylglucosaminyl deacetylase